jgi:RNA polymerase sigma factor (sigma-70 family)
MDQSGEASEQQIAQWIREDPQRGFTALLQHFGGRVKGYLRRRFPSLSADDIHDALSDAMLSLAATFDPSRGTLAAWFLFLAHQHAVATLRSGRARRVMQQLDGDSDPVDQQPSVMAQLLDQERRQEVREVLESLSELERGVIQADLDAARAVPADELSVRLKTTVGSVYSARRRARRKLLERCDWIRDGLAGEQHHDEAT